VVFLQPLRDLRLVREGQERPESSAALRERDHAKDGARGDPVLLSREVGQGQRQLSVIEVERLEPRLVLGWKPKRSFRASE